MDDWIYHYNAYTRFYQTFYWPVLDTSPDLSEGQTGKLKNSRLPFKITKVDGDDITIRYLNSRQDWIGKKADLAEVAEFDPV